MDIKTWIETCFASVCLSVEKWSRYEYAVIASKFILLFAQDRGNNEVFYIRRDTDGCVKRWNIDRFVSSLVKQEDRIGMERCEQHLEKDVLIVSRMMRRELQNLLAGDDKWMEDYFKSEYAIAPRELFGDDLKKAEQYI